MAGIHTSPNPHMRTECEVDRCGLEPVAGRVRVSGMYVGAEERDAQLSLIVDGLGSVVLRAVMVPYGNEPTAVVFRGRDVLVGVGLLTGNVVKGDIPLFATDGKVRETGPLVVIDITGGVVQGEYSYPGTGTPEVFILDFDREGADFEELRDFARRVASAIDAMAPRVTDPYGDEARFVTNLRASYDELIRDAQELEKEASR